MKKKKRFLKHWHLVGVPQAGLALLAGLLLTGVVKVELLMTRPQKNIFLPRRRHSGKLSERVCS
jgi:hypothetical protein